MGRLRIAVVSTFYPNTSAPYRTLFVRHLVTALRRRADVKVVAPIPFAPPWPRRPKWQVLRGVPRTELVGGDCVEHPRYVVVPRVPVLSGSTYAIGVAPALGRLLRHDAIDVVHVHCAYPDAVGIALVASVSKFPFVVTAHGSDINVYATRAGLKRQIRWALLRARAVIAVSEDLRSKIGALVPELRGRIRCIPCSGVDPTIFMPGEQARARRELQLESDSRIALFVGNLVPIKGIDVLFAAWRTLALAGKIADGDRLVLIGQGPLRTSLQQEALAPEVQGTIRVLGARSQAEIAMWMRASNVLCLASHHEGMPNVVIEALASGLPVVSTAVGGIPELVRSGHNGYLVGSGDPHLLAGALARALDRKWDARQIAPTAAGYNWNDLASRNLDVLTDAADT